MDGLTSMRGMRTWSPILSPVMMRAGGEGEKDTRHEAGDLQARAVHEPELAVEVAEEDGLAS